MIKTAELRDKTVDELTGTAADLKRELFNLRFQTVTGEIQNPRRIREARREIAKVKTIITEKERQVAKEAGSATPKEEGAK